MSADIYAWYFIANVRKKNKQHMLLIFISINKHKNQNYSYLQLLPSIFVGNPLFSVSKKKENTNFQVHFYD